MTNAGGVQDEAPTAEIAIWAELTVVPGQQDAADEWFRFSREVMAGESGTTSFFAVRIDETTYGVFDTFVDQAAMEAHKAGPCGEQAVVDLVGRVFTGPPSITFSRIVERT